MVNSVPDVIELFGGTQAYADAVGMTHYAAKQIKRRATLNARWFAATAEAAKVRELPITVETLARIASAA